MKIARIVFMVIACMAQPACVTKREMIPPETHAELIRLGRIITDENTPGLYGVRPAKPLI